MTAQVFTATVKPASIFSPEKSSGEARQKLDATAVAALAALTTANRVDDALDVLSACVARGNAVTASSTGLATSVQA